MATVRQRAAARRNLVKARAAKKKRSVVRASELRPVLRVARGPRPHYVVDFGGRRMVPGTRDNLG